MALPPSFNRKKVISVKQELGSVIDISGLPQAGPDMNLEGLGALEGKLNPDEGEDEPRPTPPEDPGGHG
jgi:hypothetical protein